MRGRPFLRDAKQCNYCLAVHGVVFSRPPRIVARILWLRCLECTKKLGRDVSHYACKACARRIGSVENGDGRRYIAVCAREWWRRVREQRRRAAAAQSERRA